MLVFVAILAGLFYFLNQRFHFLADIPKENINNQIELSKIPLFSDGSQKTSANEINLTVPQGESGSFEILVENNSATNYSNLTVGKNDLISSAGKTFSASNIDERVVHAWPQKLVTWGTPNTYSPEATLVDELLVKNETPNLTPPVDAKYGGDTFFSNDIGVLQNQLLKSTGDSQSETSSQIKTSLLANGKKKFFFKITAPADSVGIFHGQINLIDVANGTVVAKFSLKLTVADLIIEENRNVTSGCYINDRIKLVDQDPPTSVAHFFISEELFTERVRIIKSYGCNSVIIRVGDFADNNKMVEKVAEAGITGPIILNFYGVDSNGNLDNSDTVSSVTSSNKLKSIISGINNSQKVTNSIIFYGIDEPNTTETFAQHLEKVTNIKNIIASYGAGLNSKFKSEVTTSAQATVWENIFSAGDQYKTSYPIDHYPSSVFLDNRIFPIKNGTYTPLPNESFYFQGWNEIQKSDGSYQPINRYLSGIGLIKSGIKGSYLNPIYGYQGIAESNKPYYDDYAGTNVARWQKPMFTLYPASDGFIPTLQAESWAEGNRDIRYYQKYQALKNSSIPESKQTKLSQISAAIETNLVLYDFTVSNYTLPSGLTAKKMDKTNNLLVDYIYNYYLTEAPLPSPVLIDSINLSEGQTITTNPYIISLKLKDLSDTTKVSKVEFYIDNTLISTSTLPDVSGTYQAVWDTSKYHSVVKVILYNTDGTTETVTRNTTVNLSQNYQSPIVNILPMTGEDSIPNKIKDFITKLFK